MHNRRRSTRRWPRPPDEPPAFSPRLGRRPAGLFCCFHCPQTFRTLDELDEHSRSCQR